MLTRGSNKKKAVEAEVVSSKEATEEQQLNSRLQECPIAIIGMASVFAEAKSLDQYWDNILDSIDCIIDCIDCNDCMNATGHVRRRWFL